MYTGPLRSERSWSHVSRQYSPDNYIRAERLVIEYKRCALNPECICAAQICSISCRLTSSIKKMQNDVGHMIREDNHSMVKDIFLVGFHIHSSLKIPSFLLFLILYNVTVYGNIMITILVSISPNLKHPMFFFLANLSISDIMFTTNIVPKMLCAIVKEGVTISFLGCIIQLQFFGISLVAQCLLLAVMSYDRYLAICNPLHYVYIMDTTLCVQLVALCWFLGFVISLVTVTMTSRQDFCGPHVIDHFFCDLVPLLKLSCSDTSSVILENILLATPLTLFPLVFISVTYIYIFITILKIPSRNGREKTFSTCSSHLTIVGMFYGTLASLYVVPSDGRSLNANKVLSLLYTFVTPLFNPIIYSLRNSEIKGALRKYVFKAKEELKNTHSVQ
ncbi:olfactory receptor 1009-like [Hyla sarda]|uniref:olfactory receptor 1009-like n=1 Tax=Hyla sarda TaxID=327740 RepID=UPI0024C2DD09|nr:olfactory receptor 1009-like [Hyla sarda]